MQAFLDKCNLPALNETERKELGSNITVKDISETIKSLKGGKTPGPDGGPARNSDTSLFRRLNGPKYFPLDRHATMPTVQCYENGTHWSEGQFVRLFKKEAH